MIRRHLKFSSNANRGQIGKWRDKLLNIPCFILGNGPSLNDENISLLSPYFTVGINRAFLKLDPTVLFWQDIELWHTERKNISRLASIKICKTQSDPLNKFYHFKLEPGGFQLTKDPGTLYGSGSTGPLAVQFAHALGCSPIVLLGMDCSCRGIATDFYGKNPHHKPHTMANCMAGLKWIRAAFNDKQVISCSDNDLFPRVSLETALTRIDPRWKKDRSYYTTLLTR